MDFHPLQHTSENLFIGMIHAFQFMGIPEYVLTDNMKSVVIGRDLEGNPIWQRDYEAFMKTVGFRTKLCKPRHPFTKGKVERLVRFVKENFLVDRVFFNITDLNQAALEWCVDQNGIYHRATDVIPQKTHFKECVQRLSILEDSGALRMYLCPARKISFDGFVNYEGRRFGVPYHYLGTTVRIMRKGTTIYIYSVDLRQLLTTHEVTWSKRDRFCKDQYASQGQPEEFPTATVRSSIKMLEEPKPNLSFEKSNSTGRWSRMADMAFDAIGQYSKVLKLGFSAAEFANLAQEMDLPGETVETIASVLRRISEKKTETAINTILKMSRLPLKDPKTFENFDFSLIKGRDVERLKALPSLSAIYAHKNLAFIGPAGTGKTHLAQAFGFECCKHGMKTYFIKMSELRDKFTAARRAGREAAVLNGLVRPSCLIIDEVGHCEFDKANTRLFFDLIDRRYNKEGNFNIVFTSNKNPSQWRGNFNEDDALLCALDRIFDDATVFTIKGESFRGKRLETVALQTRKVKSVDQSE